jgi:DNA-directed RNA polymerase specialized sigma subunit
MGVGTQQLDFAEFYRGAADECLRTVLVSIGDQDTARELVDEAFAGLPDPQIMAALMRLPARQRQVVALRLILDLDTARTAEVLGIAPGTVMAHLGRAMAALRHDLQPELQQENRS